MEQSKKLRQNLMTAIFEVFEKMYYIFLEPVEKEADGKDFTAVEIGFSGVMTGSIIARFPRELSVMMTANALGMDNEEMTDQVLVDCMKECLNMFCGNFLQKQDADTRFNMTLPRTLIARESQASPGGQNYKLDLNFESDHIPLRVEIIIEHMVNK